MNTLDRRKFVNMSGAGAVAMGAVVAAPNAIAAANGSAPNNSASRKRVFCKLGCQSGPSTDEHFAFLARYGIANIVANPVYADPARLYPTVDELKALRALAEKHALSVDMTDAKFMGSGGKISDVMLGKPGRDREIEAFQTLIKNCAAAGIPAIKYNMRLLPILRSAVIPGRGDSSYHRWRIKEMEGNPLLTIWDGRSLTSGEVHDANDDAATFEKLIGRPSAEEVWSRISYFLDRVVPVANQYKVRLALHPQDPGVPPEGYHGDPRVLGTVEGLKRYVGIQESPYHGLAFCQGTISEDLEDPGHQIYDVIRWFGERKKIFLVHFRNVRGHRNDVEIEIFPDDGSVNMAKAVQVYRDVGYDGMLVPDHIPMGPEGSGPANFAFCYGYIRGLLQYADEA
ncbi:MAG TPA: mannonate dehydratase [Rhizomicrobium sp.]